VTKVVMLPGLHTTPEVFVERLREYAGSIRHIACVIQWSKDDDGKETDETNVYSTEMPLATAVWLKWIFDKDFPE
jgi:hypothetical protein